MVFQSCKMQRIIYYKVDIKYTPIKSAWTHCLKKNSWVPFNSWKGPPTSKSFGNECPHLEWCPIPSRCILTNWKEWKTWWHHPPMQVIYVKNVKLAWNATLWEWKFNKSTWIEKCSQSLIFMHHRSFANGIYFQTLPLF